MIAFRLDKDDSGNTLYIPIDEEGTECGALNYEEMINMKRTISKYIRAQKTEDIDD